MAEKYALRVEDENRSLRQKLLDATARLSTLEKELDRLRPLVLMSVAATSHRAHSIAPDPDTVKSVNALGISKGHGDRDAPVSLARRSSEASSVSVPHPAITKKRRKAKSAGTSQSLIPAPVRASHHKGSPLSDDARAECMLSAAKTVGRRRLDAMMQKGLRGIWALQQDRRDGQSGEIETSEEVADITRHGGPTPPQPKGGEWKPSPSSLPSQGDSSIQPESGSRSLNSPTRKSKAIPIIPIPTSGNVHSQAHQNGVTSTSTGSIPEHAAQSFGSAITAPPSQAAPSPTPAQEPQPRRRGRPKGAKNKKRPSQVQATDDEADTDTNTQPSQGFRSLLSAAMTLESGDGDRAEGGGEEGISQEELSGLRRTRRQTARAQTVVVELKPLRRSRPKDASAAETSPPLKRRKVATTAPSVLSPPLPPRRHASPPASRASPSSERAGPSIHSRSTPSRTLDGVSRMRSALDVLADQAIQEVRRPSLTSKADERSLQASLPLPVGSLSRPGSAELGHETATSNPPIPAGSANHSADDDAGVSMDSVEESEDELMYPPPSFTDTTFFAPRSPALATQPARAMVGEGNQHPSNPHDAGLSFVTRNSPTPHFVAVVTRDSQIENRCHARSKSLSDRDASGEPEDPEEVDMAIVHDNAGEGK
ncbi:hypothetical protein BC629DRAFT_835584 [Irpex lacteus]|nr:hypothetical protein BC629DRAFT_835584 [Irpex lacteus]